MLSLSHVPAVAGLVLALVTLTPQIASAQAPPPAAAAPLRDPAAAESLFAEARALVEAGKYAEACPKFAASHRLDPGIGVLLNLGNCWEKTGKVASSWAAYREAMYAAQTAGQQERADVAAAQITALEPRLPRLTLTMDPASRPPGLVVRRDGVELDEAVLGSPVVVDPGEHVIEASAPGRVPYRTTVISVEAAARSVEIPALAEVAGAAPIAPPLAPQREAGGDGGGWSGQRTVGVVVGGVGVVGLVIGSITGAMTLSSWSTAEKGCGGIGPTLQCTEAGDDAADDARGTATVSTISFIAGGLLVAGGVVLFLTAPDGSDGTTAAIAPWVGPDVGGGALRGIF